MVYTHPDLLASEEVNDISILNIVNAPPVILTSALLLLKRVATTTSAQMVILRCDIFVDNPTKHWSKRALVWCVSYLLWLSFFML
jgi:hypothetical protein